MKISLFSRFFFGFASICSPFVFYGQNISNPDQLEEIVIYDTSLQAHNGLKNKNVSIITAQDIKELPAKNIAEVLSYVSGVDIRSRGPFGSQSDISIDGGSFDQSILLINGQSISDAQTGHNSLNMPVSLDLVQRIEIIKGPAARLYGANSLTGVINIVTKTPKESMLFASAVIGSNFTRQQEQEDADLYYNTGVQFGASIAKKKSSHLLSASHDFGNGSRYNTDFNNDKLFYQGNFLVNSKNSIQVLAGYAKSKFGANGFYAWPSDKESQEVVQTSILHIKAKNYLSDKLSFTPSVGIRYNFDDYRFYKHDLNTARSRHYNTSVQIAMQMEYLLDKGSIHLGTQLQYDQINSTNIGNHHKNNYGIFLDYSTFVWDRLQLNTGGYVNYTSNYGWQFYPGLDLAYFIKDNWRVMANVGSATRLPTFTDLYLDQRPGNIGNPQVQPEKSYQLELGSKYEYKSFEASGFLFYRDISNFIDWVRESQDFPYQTFNIGNNKTLGVNLDGKYRFDKPLVKWYIGLSYTYLDPSIIGDIQGVESKYVLESLKHQAMARLGSNVGDWHFTLSSGYKQRLSYKSYWVNNFKVSFTKPTYDIYLDVQNFTNTTYIEAGVVPLPKAWFNLGFKFKSK
ncbi:TonB-dependent receptor plug domain-containing protein [Myroides sp. LJL115]